MNGFGTPHDSGFLARFTAAVTSAVPEFDPSDTPIGHALAVEFYAEPEPVVETVVEIADIEVADVEVADVEVVVDDEPVVLAPERVYEWPAPRIADAGTDAGTDEQDETEGAGDAVVVELPVPSAVSVVDWFAATTEPDEDEGPDEELARRAS